MSWGHAKRRGSIPCQCKASSLLCPHHLSYWSHQCLQLQNDSKCIPIPACFSKFLTGMSLSCLTPLLAHLRTSPTSEIQNLSFDSLAHAHISSSEILCSAAQTTTYAFLACPPPPPPFLTPASPIDSTLKIEPDVAPPLHFHWYVPNLISCSLSLALLMASYVNFLLFLPHPLIFPLCKE